MNEDNQWVKDIQQISKRYEMVRKKEHLKQGEEQKQIYIL